MRLVRRDHLVHLFMVVPEEDLHSNKSSLCVWPFNIVASMKVANKYSVLVV